jgi:hypothetical protein
MAPLRAESGRQIDARSDPAERRANGLICAFNHFSNRARDISLLPLYPLFLFFSIHELARPFMSHLRILKRRFLAGVPWYGSGRTTCCLPARRNALRICFQKHGFKDAEKCECKVHFYLGAAFRAVPAFAASAFAASNPR